MLPRPVAKSAENSHGKLFWMLIVSLMVGQFVAFWMLCAHQVRKAEVRDATLQVERIAMADCLRYIPKATLNSCASRIASQTGETGAVVAGGNPTSNPAAPRAKPVKVALH
jgi:hypothetical protein